MDGVHLQAPADAVPLPDRGGARRGRDDLASVRGLVLSIVVSALIYILVAKLLLPLL